MRDDNSRRLTAENGDFDAEKIEELLMNLLSIPSESKKEGDALLFLEDLLRTHGIPFRRQSVSEGRYNIIAGKSRRKGPRFLLNAHVDTVPAFSQSQLTPRKRGNLIYGRGACDTKGSLAAMLYAFIAAHELVAPKDIRASLLVTVGEEDSGDGIARFTRYSPKFDLCVVGEPTDLTICNRQAGYVEVDLRILSPSGHAFAPTTDQAPLVAVGFLSSLERQLTAMLTEDHHLYVRWLQSGQEDDFWYTRPDCQIRLLINTLEDSEIESIPAAIRMFAQKYQRKHSRDSKVEVTVEDWDQGAYTSQALWQTQLVRRAAAQHIPTSNFGTIPSWTDGSTLSASGIPVLVFGPGSLSLAHTANEKIDLRDVISASRIYYQIISDFIAP